MPERLTHEDLTTGSTLPLFSLSEACTGLARGRADSALGDNLALLLRASRSVLIG